ncbi:hypothetical protein EJ03DRAFT_330235 [Teratosphaeria nubilosa]|uniref:EamA domain-containing protein n=1 Tax=Teratosphaeria nubilosa TaxID=161662 RepID=A0A6G1L025_9PEZI|nr:hypothetical protein EJ03DRAFT_330235 [Teratosphaeria nubilosa]
MSTPKQGGDDSSRPFLDAGRPSEDDLELSELDAHRHPDAPTHQPPDFHSLHATAGPPPAQGKQSPLAVTLALALCVLGFTINTEATAYFEDELGWKKPFATLYITHGALILPWLCHVACLRFRSRKTTPYSTWVRDYNDRLRASISTVDAYATDGPKLLWKRRGNIGGPLDFLATAMALLTVVLTISGVSWFLSLSLTTPSDLTAIYNSATFFAAIFSIPLLREKLGWASIAAVALSIIGTFVIAYGDTTATHDVENPIGTNRLAGNLVACIGAMAFGLYEVLFKKWACSSRPTSKPMDTLPLTLAASALTGFYTLATLWLALLLLHIFRIETFELPSWYAALWILIAVLAGSISITLLAVLVIWTDPIFGSFANVLSVFFVALSDWLFFDLSPSIATYAGGALVVVAFSLLAWDTFAGGGTTGHG